MPVNDSCVTASMYQSAITVVPAMNEVNDHSGDAIWIEYELFDWPYLSLRLG